MPYQTIVYNELRLMGYSVHAFYNDEGRQTPYVPEEIPNVHYYPESRYGKNDLYNFIKELNPAILVICGWSSLKYMYVARRFNLLHKIPVVCPIDTQYLGKLKQKLGFIISPFYIRTAFSHIWVPGVRQYYFAKKLGYSNDRIIFNSLAGNVDLFSRASIDRKSENYPKQLLFVGRYNKVKGLHLLMDVWKSISDKKGWRIVCAGNGPLQNMLKSVPDVDVLDFLDQKALVELSEKSGAFILPSTYEPWALVLHEFAVAGLPIIASKACGASDHFVIDDYNGYTFNPNDFDDLRRIILKFINLPDSKKYLMSLNSRHISSCLTPKLSAMSLLSVLKL